ncbi:hypothetical protein TUM19329_19520 [Legionella antarctica]|uniref:AMP-dependent synthetase/ligase domain-containing protein n=1 Tax=Legionella antarctica TaxID=2708020 RepID=A0A6F8T557_9GAMM|nr:amino acid adenylation domain-containing protein [Legionella antarctica]BCA95591.1 hypothetical protein TUM19329_19520 [Legionella antarctica]
MFINFLNSFLISVGRYPDKPAIIFQDITISYKELHQRSNDFAQSISDLGNHTPIIPLFMERDADTIIAILAILKLGKVFLPISPITPCARIKFIFEDSRATVVISNIPDKLSSIIDPKINILVPSTIKKTNQDVPLYSANSNDLAYLMYTSGSTGNPKGVLIEHGSMMNLFSSLIAEIKVTESDQFLALTDYTFDISLIELLMPLLCGATILLTEQGTVADGVKIKYYLKNNIINVIQATPLTWEILLKQGWKNEGHIKILVGGEKFRTQLADHLDYMQGNVWNMYGPTETTMWSMCYLVNKPLTSESVPLGKTLNNTFIEILDDQLNRVAPGSQGELYIGGDGLARGYLNNQLLTQEKFIYHPKTNMRLYKTGDLVIADEDSLYYVGRSDDQLKFGGIRIEAGEIENVIEQEPFVKRAVVKVHETEGYYKTLAAYIEVDEEQIFSNSIHSPGFDVSHFLKNIYDETYSHANEFEHGIINNCGWQSSFTGQLFNVEELNESYHFIRKIIEQSDLTDVLEVGCGTGSLLLEYIDKAQACTVVEISSQALKYVESRLNKQQLLKTIFKNESILNVHNHHKYSCIIVNSVIQYLPSIHSLVTAITQLVQASTRSATIIIGDVRSLELMDVYLLERIRRNSATAEKQPIDLNGFYYKSRDAEIVLSPKFFYALQANIKDITHVDISVKHGTHDNELNYFRYDVILHINKPVEYLTPISFSYDPTLNIKKIKQLVDSNPTKPIIIDSIPNAAIQKLIQLIDLEIPQHVSIDSSNEQFENNKNSLNLVLTELDFENNSHDQFVLYDEIKPTTSLAVHLYPKHGPLVRCFTKTEYNHYRCYCREPFNPWLQKFCFDHIKLKVSQHVVSWVNPSVYVWIEKWPLTVNSKLDKKKLQLPITRNDASSSEPNILEQLQGMWRNITGDNALINKEFWVHGVSSLCMYFFLATINETFLVSINYHEFREYNTMDKLASYIERVLELSQS